MNKILILIKNNSIIFSKYNKDINVDNINNTNIIDVKNLKFTEEYILENLDLVSTFLNLIIKKFKINKCVIKTVDISETILKILNYTPDIKYLNFDEDKELNYTICSLLLQNIYLEKINCYNLPEIMYYRFKDNIINTRCTLLTNSNFFKYNNIKTYSDLFSSQKVVINEYLTIEDIDDIVYFFNSNKNIKRIELKRYNKQNLEAILKMLRLNNINKVTIIIYEDSSTTDLILNDIKYFDTLTKKFNVNIKIKYSYEYKEKNGIKEINIQIFKFIIIILILTGLVLTLLFTFLHFSNNKKVENISKKINDNINNSLENYSNIIEDKISNTNLDSDNKKTVSSYYTSYNNVYDELKKINSDTIGFIKINNTQINYPVVQSTDNEYYLNHAYDKSKNLAGWIFVDYRNKFSSGENIIIYGHTVENSKVMFSTLDNVLKQEWYSNESNLNIFLNILGNDFTYKIFSIYIVDNTSDYLYTEFYSESSFNEYIKLVKSRSIFNFNLEVKYKDDILTLSTCYKDSSKKIVVHAKRI